MCCGGSVSSSMPLNEYGCHDDQVKVTYVGTKLRVVVNGNYYGQHATGDQFCVRPKDADAPIFEIAS